MQPQLISEAIMLGLLPSKKIGPKQPKRNRNAYQQPCTIHVFAIYPQLPKKNHCKTILQFPAKDVRFPSEASYEPKRLSDIRRIHKNRLGPTFAMSIVSKILPHNDNHPQAIRKGQK